ncbi:MAG: hypothetical protein ACLP56_03555 [Candidatus Sulfotelmatobacter sp.]
MNPVLEAISINVSALPGAIAAVQPASGQRGSGGFASTLAAAQGLSTASQTAAAAVTAEAQSAGTATNLNAGKLAPGSPQSKKLPSGGAPVAAKGEPAVNAVVPPPIVDTASQNPVAVLQPSFTQPSLAPAPTTAQSAPFASSAPAQTAGVSESLTGTEGIAANLSRSLAPGTAVSAYSTAREQAAPGAASPDTVSGGQGNGSANGSVSAAPTLPAGNTQPPALPVTAVQAPSSAALPSITPGKPEGGLQADGLALGTGAAESATLAPTLPAGNTQPPLRFFFTAAQASSSAASPNGTPGMPESGPQANASAPAGPAARVQPSIETDLQSVPANTSDAVATGAVNQNEPGLPAGTASTLSEIVNGQTAAPSILNPAGQPLPDRAAPRFAAARVTAGVSATSVRGAGQIPVSTSSSASSSSLAISTGSDAGSELPVASQTPFSVFFSSAGPGTEAAASALPKMMLPVASTTIRSGYSTSAAPAPGTSPQAGALPNNATPPVPQANKDSLAGSQGGSVTAGQPLHSNADQVASNVPAVASQLPTAPPPLPSAAVAGPPSGGPPPPADSLPQPGTPPGNAAGGAASVVPPAPPVPATLPGPVQVAQLVNRVGQSEMRIGMNTSAFGGVEVRTVVHASEVGMIIGSEKGDLRGLLANEMPAIANTLQQQNLRLNSVSFMQGSAFSNNASGGGASQQQRSFVPAPAYANSAPSEATVDDFVETLPAVEYGGGGNGLSILA